MKKRLYRSSTDKAIAGVCGGIAAYLDIDSIIIRLLFVLFSLAGGAGLLFYIVAALIMPTEEAVRQQEYYEQQRSPYPGTSYVTPEGTVYQNSASAFAGAQKPVEASYTATEAPDAEYDDVDASTREMPEDGVVFEDVTLDRSAKASVEETTAQEAPKSAQAGTSPKQDSPRKTAGPGPSPYRQTQQGSTAGSYSSQPSPEQDAQKNNSGKVLGWICLVAGAAMLVQFFVPHIPIRLLFAAFVIFVGLVLLLRKK